MPNKPLRCRGCIRSEGSWCHTHPVPLSLWLAPRSPPQPLTHSSDTCTRCVVSVGSTVSEEDRAAPGRKPGLAGTEPLFSDAQLMQ